MTAPDSVDPIEAAEQQRATSQAVREIMRRAEIDAELHRLDVRNTARDVYTARQAGQAQLPERTSLADFLAVPDDPIAYRIDGLWPAGGRVLLAAQYKSGKSTAVANLLRSLADGAPFLARYDTQPVERVVLIDDELDPRTLRRWLRDQNIVNERRVDPVALRGNVAAFDLLNPATRARWADLVRPADVLILDCLRPVLDAIGLSEDKDAGRFLVAFDALLHEAGVGEAMVVHHAGHSGERARGDSRLRDWPDAEWRIVRDGDEPDAPRYFAAFGRDVDVKEQRVMFEPLDRSLWLDGGSRRDAKIDDAVDGLLDLLAGQDDPISGRAIETQLVGAHAQKSVRAAIRKAVAAGQVLIEEGPRRAQLHYLNPSLSLRRTERRAA